MKKAVGLTVGGYVVGIILGLLITAALALALELAWNVVVPALVHGPALDYAQAFAILVLLNLAVLVVKAFK